MNEDRLVIWLDECGRKDIDLVGGKNASLGEMLDAMKANDIPVPQGFATTSHAYRLFVQENGLEKIITEALSDLADGVSSLQETGARIRSEFMHARWPHQVAKRILSAYARLSERLLIDGADVAVRSSATAEDLPEASFAGQQESFLNIRGEEALLAACKRCYASLFTDRAITYRNLHGFDHLKVALSIGIQAMVRSDVGSSGVMFTIDTETGFDKVVVINAAWGLGESIVQGKVEPDEFVTFKPFLDHKRRKPILEKRLGAKQIKLIYGSGDEATQYVPTSVEAQSTYCLSDSEVLTLSRWACAIEQHYGVPMDIEWAKDGTNERLYIVQARPETVQSRNDSSLFTTYEIASKGQQIVSGVSVGDAVATGRVVLLESPEQISEFVDGSILVTGDTDPDWVPIMKRAAGIVTDHGGRTSHAAIVSRELGLPAIVGTRDATRRLHTGQDVTLSCAEGDVGFVYEGVAQISRNTISAEDIPETETQVMLNLANPGAAFRWWKVPADGVGLARMEFVIGNHIKIHPMALARFDEVKDEQARSEIESLTAGYPRKRDFFIEKLAVGLARIAATVHPKPVIVRMSDFKTNEYANLIGGRVFEPVEENPMIGFRGASRYYSESYETGFAMECEAIAKLRDELGFDNVIVMIPFCRSPAEADRVLEVMASKGMKRGDNGLQVFMMCEVPSNVILADAFARRFDGFSIGSNDLTQLTLGVDRDNEILSDLFDEENDAVKWMISKVIVDAHKLDTRVGLCGQAPSDKPGFAEFLVRSGIDSISVTPDSFVSVKKHVACAEQHLRDTK
ncbi:phosphoenolpyruvate synthase [Hoeflea prorocentri]|uniref:Phosphoenolpyruvate synthase n=1 Tax=Hoeflea prorocentri TaxID=1922333 RepID=A0A9X3ZGE5_9HYPH|nr:phosphoenolpyruvate synthase [Hoeflea prorocentri]MCY6379665.1 phosphoenolpyruvate synthase [Hoeflea prorocentri]MDA5397465.1 phosphoenolpyruvate synthase [Hoeflea prorocentri]